MNRRRHSQKGILEWFKILKNVLFLSFLKNNDSLF